VWRFGRASLLCQQLHQLLPLRQALLLLLLQQYRCCTADC
jgi:hypothetical protein